LVLNPDSFRKVYWIEHGGKPKLYDLKKKIINPPLAHGIKVFIRAANGFSLMQVGLSNISQSLGYCSQEALPSSLAHNTLYFLRPFAGFIFNSGK
jgi:hypothetical protein